MAFCSKCGKQLMNGAKFCANCGVAVNAPETGEQRKACYDGEIHKCVYCGAELPSFATECPVCGKELRGISATNSVKELARKLEEIELKKEKPNWSNFLMQTLSRKKLRVADEQKIAVIQNFPIPNAKEDILEFIVLASSNMKSKCYGSTAEQYAHQTIVSAWNTKLEQACQKAILNFSADEIFLEKLEEITGKKLRKQEKKKFFGLW